MRQELKSWRVLLRSWSVTKQSTQPPLGHARPDHIKADQQFTETGRLIVMWYFGGNMLHDIALSNFG